MRFTVMLADELTIGFMQLFSNCPATEHYRTLVFCIEQLFFNWVNLGLNMDYLCTRHSLLAMLPDTFR